MKKLFWRLLFIFCILLLTCAIIFWKDILGIKRWDGHRRFSLVYAHDPVIVVSLEPEERKASVIVVPDASYMMVARGYGPYKASSIYALGELEPRIGGGRLLSETAQDVFGVPVDGYIKFDDMLTHGQLPSFQAIKENYFNLFNIFKGKKTNLLIQEVIRFYMGVFSLRGDGVRIIDLGGENILTDISLPDGSKVGKIDPDRLDKKLEDAFGEKEILKENLSISIKNASNTEGKAGSIARLIGHMGGKVVSVGNSEKVERKHCKIFSEAKYSNSYTVARIAYIFDCTIEKMKEDGISDLSIIIGRG